MGLNDVISKLFGNKSTRDMREIQPWVEKVKAAYKEVEQLSNDDLRERTKVLKARILASAEQERARIAELKSKVEETELEDREALFNQIDKMEKDVLEIYEKAMDEALPEAFAIIKETARRFTENEEVEVTATDF